MTDPLSPAVQEAFRAAVREELAAPLDELRRFVDRRMAEVSAELHSTAQLLGFSEDNLSGQLARLQEQIATIAGSPSAAAKSSGMELEAVVQTTEAAANQIMEAAEAISDCLTKTKADQAAMGEIAERLNAIFEACAFQDLTGQRVRRAISHLQEVEHAIGGLITPAAAAPPAPKPGTAARDPLLSGPGPGMSQADIDAMLAF